MSAGDAKVYLFVVRYPHNPQWDRAVYLYYSSNRASVTKWKICKVKYIEGGADIDSKKPLFQGTADLNGLYCHLSTPTVKNFIKLTFPNSLYALKKGDEGVYEEGGQIFPLVFITERPGEFYEAFIPNLVAA